MEKRKCPENPGLEKIFKPENTIIFKLGNDVIGTILGMLSFNNLVKLSHVCKKFAEVVGDLILWVEESFWQFKFSLSKFQALCRVFPHIKSIEFRGWMISNSELKYLFQKCQDIQEINLGHSGNISDDGFPYLSQLGFVKKIILENSDRITDDALKSLSTGCGLLEHIELNSHPKITAIGLKSLALGCPLLNYIRFSTCYDLSGQVLMSVAQVCPKLSRIMVWEDSRERILRSLWKGDTISTFIGLCFDDKITYHFHDLKNEASWDTEWCCVMVTNKILLDQNKCTSIRFRSDLPLESKWGDSDLSCDTSSEDDSDPDPFNDFDI